MGHHLFTQCSGNNSVKYCPSGLTAAQWFTLSHTEHLVAFPKWEMFTSSSIRQIFKISSVTERATRIFLDRWWRFSSMLQTYFIRRLYEKRKLKSSMQPFWTKFKCSKEQEPAQGTEAIIEVNIYSFFMHLYFIYL